MTAFKQLFGLALILLAAALAAGCSGSEANEAAATAPEARAVPVRVERVKPQTLRDVLVLPGETEARHDVRLAAETDGQVKKTGPAEGEAVHKGQLVAAIDVDALEAQLGKAKAAFKLADEQAKRRQALHERKVLPTEELDQALTQRAAALADLKQAQVYYDKGIVRSPIDGRVNKLYVDPGEFIGAGDPVAELVDTRQIRINLNVPELDVRFLSVDQPVRVVVDALPERQWLGKVDFVAYKADPATKTFKVRVVVDNDDGSIRPGMIARVALLRRQVEGAITAPLRAIVDKGGERLVFVVKEGVAKARKVELGVIEGDRIQVLDGLAAGDELIVAGQSEVEEGAKVKVQ